MRPGSPSFVFALLLLALTACSEPRTGGPIAVQQRDGSMNAADALAGTDASETSDTGGTEDDSGMTPEQDSGEGSGDSGASPSDAGSDQDADPSSDSGLTGACADLYACCSALPSQLQAQCMTTASAGNDQQCTMFLSLAQQAGLCTGSGTDAGPRDVGPLGPACTDYLACCPTLGPLQMQCETSAMNGDEMICAQSLSALQMAGFCGGDASFPSFDAFPPFDAQIPSFDASVPD